MTHRGEASRRTGILAEGKTKIIRAAGAPAQVLVINKDDIIADDGARHDIMPGKGAYSARTASNCFRLLENAGIPTHFIRQETADTFLAHEVKMIPIELVARRIAYGSYTKRNPHIPSETRFDDVVLEMFAKDNATPDPLLHYDFTNGTVSRYAAEQPIGRATLLDTMPINESPFALTEEQHDMLRQLTADTFGVLEVAWKDRDVALVDLKIECGVTVANEAVVAGTIDNDSWRIWPGGNPDHMQDKQLFRDGMLPLNAIADRYAWVAAVTDDFAYR